MATTTIQTPKADKALQAFTLKTKEGIFLHETATLGQKEIMDCILGREAQNGSRRVHIMAHTRYGKSLAVGAAVAIRAAIKKEPWAIVSATKEQAQIIMDYVIHFAINDPIISHLLKTDLKELRAERLTQRRSRDHITFLNGGEVRTFFAGGAMGFGSPNIVLDEAGLIGNDEESKVFRMLGDSTDNFIVKIGNPWDSVDPHTGDDHHFFTSYTDPEYYMINIDIYRGIQEGRVTEEFHNEVKKKPNYAVLYLNTFPDAQRVDKDGYLPMWSHSQLQGIFCEPGTIAPVGRQVLGCDPADGGANEGVIAKRSMNLARVVFTSNTVDKLGYADEIAKVGEDCEDWFVDGLGVGRDTIKKLKEQAKLWRKTTDVNIGGKPSGKVDPEESFLNIRSYLYWQMKVWTEQGGRIERTPKLQKQMLAIKWKNQGKRVKIIDKDTLRKRGVDDLGRADAISLTFAEASEKYVADSPGGGERVRGGVDAYYPDLGF